MEAKNNNRVILEKIAREVMKMEDEEQINAFVATFIYSVLTI